VIAAHWQHGRETVQSKAARSKRSALLMQLEDATRVLGMFSGGRTRGRKPLRYAPVTSVDDVLELVLREAGLVTKPTP
jgi:hypothetical protein